MVKKASTSFMPDELMQALKICSSSNRDRNKPYKFWHSAGWLDVEEVLGKVKSEEVLNHLLELEKIFEDIEISFLLRLKERGEPPYLFSHCDSIISEFKAKCTSAPSVVANAFEANFCLRHR